MCPFGTSRMTQYPVFHIKAHHILLLLLKQRKKADF